MGVDGFCAEYGEEHRESANALIETDWMSDEHSDCGDASEALWNAHRDRHSRCGKNALELRKLQWRSPQVSVVVTNLTTSLTYMDLEDEPGFELLYVLWSEGDIKLG